ncbi:hypothetical protein HJG60_008840 [Phyllostomus discolor]|uniref:Uncharacterized protein n=1 Tax=Phyllostomus discolor TaxID=89673 RepID=A0A833YWF9_9CHIR|nr:hypothetical protein HJG60_008840 [Phyllostomus discolor]
MTQISSWWLHFHDIEYTTPGARVNDPSLFPFIFVFFYIEYFIFIYFILFIFIAFFHYTTVSIFTARFSSVSSMSKTYCVLTIDCLTFIKLNHINFLFSLMKTGQILAISHGLTYAFPLDVVMDEPYFSLIT